MNLETIRTDTHVLLIDTEALSEKGDWTYCKVLNILSQTDKFTDFEYINQTDNVCKVLSAYPKLDNVPEFEILPTTVAKLFDAKYEFVPEIVETDDLLNEKELDKFNDENFIGNLSFKQQIVILDNKIQGTWKLLTI